MFAGKVARSESLRAGTEHQGDGWSARRWLDHLDTQAEPELVADDGTVACWKQYKTRYCATWPEGDVISEIVSRAASDAGLAWVCLPEGIRTRKSSNYRFVFNYSADARALPATFDCEPLIGSRILSPADVAIFDLS